jgi:hypothetical protein
VSVNHSTSYGRANIYQSSSQSSATREEEQQYLDESDSTMNPIHQDHRYYELSTDDEDVHYLNYSRKKPKSEPQSVSS